MILHFDNDYDVCTSLNNLEESGFGLNVSVANHLVLIACFCILREVG